MLLGAQLRRLRAATGTAARAVSAGGRRPPQPRLGPPPLWAVVDEGALRRPIGGPAVMRDQLDALIATTRRPRIRLQVIPFHVGGHAAAGGAFTILRFA